MGYMVSADDGWRMPDCLWARLGPPPPLSFHPLGARRERQLFRHCSDALCTYSKETRKAAGSVERAILGSNHRPAGERPASTS